MEEVNVLPPQRPKLAGFPLVFSVGALVAVGSFALVTLIAVAMIAVPGYLAARVSPAVSLQD